MRTRSIMIAALVAASASLNAQTPQPQTPQTPQPQTTRPTTGDTTQRTAAGADQVITITGCLKDEKDVPGRKPNMAERAGITEDYILTNVKMAGSSQTSAIGLGSMYEIEAIAEAELKKHLNHQVEVMGRISQRMGGAGSTATTAGGSMTQRGNDDVPDFQATSLKMISASCPAGQ